MYKAIHIASIKKVENTYFKKVTLMYLNIKIIENNIGINITRTIIIKSTLLRNCIE